MHRRCPTRYEEYSRYVMTATADVGMYLFNRNGIFKAEFKCKVIAQFGPIRKRKGVVGLTQKMPHTIRRIFPLCHDCVGRCGNVLIQSKRDLYQGRQTRRPTLHKKHTWKLQRLDRIQQKKHKGRTIRILIAFVTNRLRLIAFTIELRRSSSWKSWAICSR